MGLEAGCLLLKVFHETAVMLSPEAVISAACSPGEGPNSKLPHRMAGRIHFLTAVGGGLLLFPVSGPYHRAVHNMAAGLPQSKQVREIPKKEAMVFMEPNVRIDIPSLLPLSILQNHIRKSSSYIRA